MIKVISAYQVSHAIPSQAGELTYCKQQVRSMLRKGIKHPNPKKVILTDLSNVITKWRKEGKQHEVVLMVDMNKCGDLQDFYLENDVIDTVGILKPTQTNDTTYLYGKNRPRSAQIVRALIPPKFHILCQTHQILPYLCSNNFFISQLIFLS